MGIAEFFVAHISQCANKDGIKAMLVFLDCEFPDFIDCELISLALVSEDGQRDIYFIWKWQVRRKAADAKHCQWDQYRHQCLPRLVCDLLF